MAIQQHYDVCFNVGTGIVGIGSVSVCVGDGSRRCRCLLVGEAVGSHSLNEALEGMT